MDRFVGLLEASPDYGPELAASLRSEITRLINREPERIESAEFARWRESIDRLLRLAQQRDGKEASLAEMAEQEEQERAPHLPEEPPY